MTTAQTSEHRSDAVACLDVPTVMAHLGGKPGVYCDEVPTSLFRFVSEHAQQLTPARAEDLSVQSGLGGGAVGVMASLVIGSRSRASGEVGDGQVLMGDEVIAIHQSPRELVVVIPTLVGDLAVQPTDGLAGFPAPVRPSASTGHQPPPRSRNRSLGS